MSNGVQGLSRNTGRVTRVESPAAYTMVVDGGDTLFFFGSFWSFVPIVDKGFIISAGI